MFTWNSTSIIHCAIAIMITKYYSFTDQGRKSTTATTLPPACLLISTVMSVLAANGKKPHLDTLATLLLLLIDRYNDLNH